MKTGLRIRVLEGQTVDGRTDYEFPSSPQQPEEQIVIGRDPDRCDIVFVDDLRERGLGNEHVALRRSLARYQLDINTHNAVRVDGRNAFEEQELSGTHVLQLANAAKLEVTVVDDRSATIGNTGNRQPHEVAAGTRRLLAALGCATALLAIAGWWGMSRESKRAGEAMRAAAETKSAVDSLTKEAAETRATLASLSSIGAVSDDVISTVRESIYAVILRTREGEDILGTGWSAPGGKVVTNAHVIELEDDPTLKKLVDEGAELLVRSAVAPYRTHRVTARTPHPGRRRFLEVMSGMQPLITSVGGFRKFDVDSGCDVAVLDVEDAAALAAPLTIATPDELRALRSGQPIAMVGYPGQDMLSNLVTRPEPVSQKASIVRLTDFFMQHRDDGNNQLVQHSLPAAGGASGSPIVNTAGHVIAILDAISSLSVPESGGQRTRLTFMNPAAVNFAQRVDFAVDLLEGRGAEAADRYAKEWLDRLEQMDLLSEQIVPLTEKKLTSLLGRPVNGRVVHRFEGRTTRLTGDPARDTKAAVEFDAPGGLISVVVVPREHVDVDVALLDRSRLITETVDESLAYHGHILFANRFPRTLRLLAGVDGRRVAEPSEYDAEVIVWDVDAEEYLAAMAMTAAHESLEMTAQPTRSFDLEPVPLDEAVDLDGRKVVVGKVSWTLPAKAVCAITCRPSQPTEVSLMGPGSDGLLEMSRAESPYAIVPCLEAGEPTRLILVAPAPDPNAEVPKVAVHVDAWLAAEPDK